MKSLNLLNFILLGLVICFVHPVSGQELTPGSPKDLSLSKDQKPKMQFKTRHINLGKVKKGENIPFSYHFTNTGTVDFTIDFVSGCDCTELDWPVKTFKPGESGKIDVVFLSSKKEKSETVEIDVLLKNADPVTKNPFMEILSYSYEFK